MNTPYSVLVDSNIWMKFLSSGHTKLTTLLSQKCIVTHPFIIGEIACGGFPNRDRQLRSIKKLRSIGVSDDQSVLSLIETNRWMSTGIGYIDAHLLATVIQSKSVKLWTKHNPLKKQAKRYGIAYP